MGQYHPEFEVFEIKGMDRRIERKEMERAFELAGKYGITNLEP